MHVRLRDYALVFMCNCESVRLGACECVRSVREHDCLRACLSMSVNECAYLCVPVLARDDAYACQLCVHACLS